jgi:tetratricopeptide (TPR) repeat protein
VLRDLAASPDEDRRARLLEALAAYTEALLHYRPDTAPLDYAAAQNNRGTVLSDLAASPDEDRRARLLEALAAYTEALHFRRPDTAPLDYAMTQANIALLYMDISYFPEENQRKQHGKAITSTVTALSIFLQIGHQPYAQHTAKQLKWISEQIGDSFRDLWLELDLGEIPDWLKNSG